MNSGAPHVRNPALCAATQGEKKLCTRSVLRDELKKMEGKPRGLHVCKQYFFLCLALLRVVGLVKLVHRCQLKAPIRATVRREAEGEEEEL